MRAGLPARREDQVGGLLGDHDRRRVGVARDERRHDRGVDDPQARDRPCTAQPCRRPPRRRRGPSGRCRSDGRSSCRCRARRPAPRHRSANVDLRLPARRDLRRQRRLGDDALEQADAARRSRPRPPAPSGSCRRCAAASFGSAERRLTRAAALGRSWQTEIVKAEKRLQAGVVAVDAERLEVELHVGRCEPRPGPGEGAGQAGAEGERAAPAQRIVGADQHAAARRSAACR